MFFFRFEVARNGQVELQVSIFTFLSHSPLPWRVHGGVWSQMVTGWAASGCKKDFRRRLCQVFGNWWSILVLPHRRVPRDCTSDVRQCFSCVSPFMAYIFVFVVCVFHAGQTWQIITHLCLTCIIGLIK